MQSNAIQAKIAHMQSDIKYVIKYMIKPVESNKAKVRIALTSRDKEG